MTTTQPAGHTVTILSTIAACLESYGHALANADVIPLEPGTARFIGSELLVAARMIGRESSRIENGTSL